MRGRCGLASRARKARCGPGGGLHRRREDAQHATLDVCPGDEDQPSAAKALQPQIGADAQHTPAVGAAGVGLLESEHIVQVERQGSRAVGAYARGFRRQGKAPPHGPGHFTMGTADGRGTGQGAGGGHLRRRVRQPRLLRVPVTAWGREAETGRPGATAPWPNR